MRYERDFQRPSFNICRQHNMPSQRFINVLPRVTGKGSFIQEFLPVQVHSSLRLTNYTNMLMQKLSLQW